MSASLVYSIVNFGVVPAWALLVFAPRWRGTWWVIHAITIPLLLTVVYVAGLVVGEMPEGASGATLEQMQRIFDAPWIAVSCWVHFIVGDLFVGAWISRDALRRDLSYPFLAAPAILGAMFFMPAGLSFYLIARAIRTRAWSLDERPRV